MEIKRTNPGSRYADAVCYNGTVYLVEVPCTEKANFAQQAQEVLTSLENQLKAQESDKGHILMATIYLTDMGHYDEFNRLWEAWLPTGCAPIRACLAVSQLANKNWQIEIALNAVVVAK